MHPVASEFVPQDIGEKPARLHGQFLGLAVYGQDDLFHQLVPARS
jgi:hypothetical protein